MKIIGDSPTIEDGLGFDSYEDILLEAIKNFDATSPLTIGIHGSWGSGKTSLMKMLEERLKGFLFSIDVDFEEPLKKDKILKILKDRSNDDDSISISSDATIDAVSQIQSSAKKSLYNTLSRIKLISFRKKSNYGSVVRKNEDKLLIDEWEINDKEKYNVKKEHGKLNIYKYANNVKTIWFNAGYMEVKNQLGWRCYSRCLASFKRKRKTPKNRTIYGGCWQIAY